MISLIGSLVLLNLLLRLRKLLRIHQLPGHTSRLWYWLLWLHWLHWLRWLHWLLL